MFLNEKSHILRRAAEQWAMIDQCKFIILTSWPTTHYDTWHN